LLGGAVALLAGAVLFIANNRFVLWHQNVRVK
jgi:hypothetical protein